MLETAGSNSATLNSNNVSGAYTSNSSLPFPETSGTILTTDVQTGEPAGPNSQSTLAPAPTANGNSSAGSLSVANGGSASPQVGDYVVNSLTVGDGASLTPSGSNSQNPSNTVTQVYINGGNSGQNVVSINGNVNAGGDPANFEIFYNGSGTIAIGDNATGGTAAGPITVNATIYAPNATVLMSGSTKGNTVNFTGAVAANMIAGSQTSTGGLMPTQNLSFQFDNDLITNGALAGGLNPSQAASLSYNPNSLNSAIATPQLKVVYYWESE